MRFLSVRRLQNLVLQTSDLIYSFTKNPMMLGLVNEELFSQDHNNQFADLATTRPET